jgi:uncharacterized protein (TIGR00296 family)
LSFELSDEEGVFLTTLARKAIISYLETGKKMAPPQDISEKLKTKCGVFVTLNKITDGNKELRGCIGFPEPVMPLIAAVIDSAINAAVEDPRFPPVSEKEMNRITVEISVLTPLQLITVNEPREYPNKIKIGVDGLVVERGWSKGLLLPQVPVEWKWDEEEFLANCCMKAGLPPDAWLIPGTKIYKFQAIIFEEQNPNGKVERLRLKTK